eukprot:Rhum_TRINITY_DN14343_c15_g1::Rhum_TRINITY_DN14343_c15_g1_i1::g.83902::m.83902
MRKRVVAQTREVVLRRKGKRPKIRMAEHFLSRKKKASTNEGTTTKKSRREDKITADRCYTISFLNFKIIFFLLFRVPNKGGRQLLLPPLLNHRLRILCPHQGGAHEHSCCSLPLHHLHVFHRRHAAQTHPTRLLDRLRSVSVLRILEQVARPVQVHLERLQVTVVHTDDARARRERSVDLSLRHHLHEGLHAPLAAVRNEARQRLALLRHRVGRRHNQQKRVGAARTSLEHLVLADDEVLPQHSRALLVAKRRNLPPHLLQVVQRPLEPHRLCQHRDHLHTGVRVLCGQRQQILRGDVTLARRRPLQLGGHAHRRNVGELGEQVQRLRRRRGRGLQVVERALLAGQSQVDAPALEDA